MENPASAYHLKGVIQVRLRIRKTVGFAINQAGFPGFWHQKARTRSGGTSACPEPQTIQDKKRGSEAFSASEPPAVFGFRTICRDFFHGFFRLFWGRWCGVGLGVQGQSHTEISEWRMRGVGRGTSLSTAARFRTPWNMCGTLYRETGPPVWEGNTQGLLPLFPSAFEKRPSGRQMAK